MPPIESQTIRWKGKNYLARKNHFVTRVKGSTGETEAGFEKDFDDVKQSVNGSKVLTRRGAWGLIRFPSTNSLEMTLDKVASNPANQGKIAFVEPDFLVEGTINYLLPSEGSWLWGLPRMNVPQVWANGQVGSDEILIGIADTGIVPHPELDPNRLMYGGRFISSDPDFIVDINGQFDQVSIADVAAGHNHGVMVAGILGARREDLGKGVAGVNQGSPIGICKALDDFNTGTAYSVLSSVLQCIEGAAQLGKKLIINLSLALPDETLSAEMLPQAGPNPPQDTPEDIAGPQPTADGLAEDEATERSENILAFKFMCEAVRNAGAIVVCAGGNKGDDVPRAPAFYAKDFPEAVVAVGYTQEGAGQGSEINGEFIHPNSHGGVDVVAPGTDWPILYRDGTVSLFSAEGSSVATPLVTGALSLIWSKSPELTAEEVINLLKNSCDLPNGVGALDDPKWGHGRINVQAALEGIENA